jgi:hypothetical protein
MSAIIERGIGHPATTLVRAAKDATFADRSPPAAAGYVLFPGVAYANHISAGHPLPAT